MRLNSTDYLSEGFSAATLPDIDESNRWLPPRAEEPYVINQKLNHILQRFLDRLHDLMLLPANWDSYGARPINIKSVGYSIALFCEIMFENTPEPQVVPTKSGDVQLEWHIYGIDLEIEICSDRIVHCYATDANNKFETLDWSDSLYYAIEGLKPYMEELTSRANSNNFVAA